MIDEACARGGRAAPRDVDVVACGAGPGSFTGLRIGLATAKGLCFALDRPLVMVSSLAALAARAPDGRVCATLDAFKGEVYAGIFTVAGGVPILDSQGSGAEAVLPPATLRAAPGDVAFVVGSRRARSIRELAAAPVAAARRAGGPPPRRRRASRRFARRARRLRRSGGAPRRPTSARPRPSWSSQRRSQ